MYTNEILSFSLFFVVACFLLWQKLQPFKVRKELCGRFLETRKCFSTAENEYRSGVFGYEENNKYHSIYVESDYNQYAFLCENPHFGWFSNYEIRWMWKRFLKEQQKKHKEKEKNILLKNKEEHKEIRDKVMSSLESCQ